VSSIITKALILLKKHDIVIYVFKRDVGLLAIIFSAVRGGSEIEIQVFGSRNLFLIYIYIYILKVFFSIFLKFNLI
jgi:hypothetical protein